MKLKNLIVRSYIEEIDKARVEDLERRCRVGLADHAFFTCWYNMLVAEYDKEIVGVIQGSIKVVTIHINPSKDTGKVGYILGLRVSPPHRHNSIGSTLVHHLEQWFVAHHVDFAQMATEKDNQPSVLTEKLGFIKFTTPTILVHPIHKIPFQLPSRIEISKLLLSCPEDLWCIKPLKDEERETHARRLHEMTKIPSMRPLFVDPRDVLTNLSACLACLAVYQVMTVVGGSSPPIKFPMS